MATKLFSTLTLPGEIESAFQTTDESAFQTTELTVTPFAMHSFPTTEDTNSDTSGLVTPDTMTTVMTSLTSDPYPTSRSPTMDTTLLHNMTKEDIEEYLEHLENEEFILYIPTMAFLVFLCLVGLFGNTLVLLVYKSKFHRTPTRIFIMAIAAFDLIANTVCIPGDIYDYFNLWTYSIPILCRLVRYANASTTITSACILLALSIARYRKICRPFGKQVTTRHAKFMTIGIAIFGWSASIPFCILNGIHTRPTPRSGIFGHECSIDDAYIDTIWPLANSGFFLLLFLSLCTPLVVLYILIGRQAYKHSKIHGRSMVNMKASSTATYTHTLSTEDALDKPAGGLWSKIRSLRSRKKYEIRTGSENLDSYNSGVPNTRGDEVMTSETGESILMKGKNGAPENTREDSTSSVQFNRSLSGAKNHVNFSMVRELTLKLKDIKQSDDSKSNDANSDVERKESDVNGSDKEGNIDVIAQSSVDEGAKEIMDNSLLNADNNSKSDPNCSDNIMAMSTEDKEGSSEKSEPEGHGIASRLQWIDATFSLQEDDNDPTITADNDVPMTPTKKTSLSRKVSRENSLLQKQRKIREAFMEKLKKRRQSGKDDEQDDKGDETNDNTESEGEVIDEAKACETTTKRRNSPPVDSSVKFVNKQQDSSTKNGVKKPSCTKSNQRSSVLNRTTVMLLLITSVYVLSYVPYLVLVFFRFTQPENFKAMGKASVATYNLFLRTYFVNSAANAVIYSLCDHKFRREALNLFKCQK